MRTQSGFVLERLRPYVGQVSLPAGSSMPFVIPRRILIAVVTAVAACSSDSTGAGDVLVVAQIEIDPPGAGLIIGGTQQFTAVPKTSSGIPVPNRSVIWSSDNPGIATVSENGRVTAVSLGETNIKATVDQVTAGVAVNVSPKPVAEVLVQPTSASIQAGQTQQLTVTVKAADGETLSDRTITYDSDDPAIATVSASGLVTGMAPGQTTVSASSEGKVAGYCDLFRSQDQSTRFGLYPPGDRGLAQSRYQQCLCGGGWSPQ
jgi:uncharacterized protein YjdB